MKVFRLPHDPGDGIFEPMSFRATKPVDAASATLLARLGTQRAPLSQEELIASRSSAPDPELTGTPEPIEGRAEVTLPLGEVPLRARLYRDNLLQRQPIILWL